MTNAWTELRSLADRFDWRRIGQLAKRVDLARLVGVLVQLEPEDLAHLASQVRAKHRKEPLPEVHGDFYGFGRLLGEEDLALKLRVRDAMARHVAPIVNDYWLRGHGGNGILLSHDVARFVADAEALYSYEGTKQINGLIVGRAITGFSAFV
jgi:alkylation response protein AidB-like acyl-CoA dehydrogenase